MAGMDPMFRLVALAHGIERARGGGLWPGEGPSDERLLIMAGNFTRAAQMINNSISAGQPSPPSAESETPADGRTHSMHVLYVAAHEVTVGLAEHGSDRHRTAAPR